MTEFEQKQKNIQALMNRHELDALLLQRVASFAWATCGATSYVNSATSFGEASLLIAPRGLHLVTNNIEATRLEKEEHLKEQGWNFHVAPWHESSTLLEELTRGLKLGADSPFPGADNLSGEVSRLRTNLTTEEGQRFRTLSRSCARAMNSAIRSIKPGMTEYEIAAAVANEAQRLGVQPIVNLIATDERIYNFRHPLPTDKKMERYAMLVLCGRKWGLVCSITRLVHFGRLPEELRRKVEAVAFIDATFLAATRPGNTLGQIMEKAIQAYAETGYPDEWRLHHQGGPASYEPRESVATPGSQDQVAAGQVYAWNPSITGAKSEDTILVSETGIEVMTEIEGWPVLPVEVDGTHFLRPAILEVE